MTICFDIPKNRPRNSVLLPSLVTAMGALFFFALMVAQGPESADAMNPAPATNEPARILHDQ